MYFHQKSSKIMIRNFSKYIVTVEIKIFLECLVLGMGFIIYKFINFG